MSPVWGAHKSAYCKFCPIPPKNPPPKKKTSDPHIQTTTELFLRHPHGQLKVVDFDQEVGEPEALTPICECVFEEEKNRCPKCAPPKVVERPKECHCHPGTKYDKSTYNPKTLRKLARRLAKEKKKKEPDLELWFEKQSRKLEKEKTEQVASYHATIVDIGKEIDTREEKKEKVRVSVGGPPWFLQFSCQQIAYVEYLSTAVRFDIDDDDFDKSLFILKGLGMFPHPKARNLKKSLSICNYNTVEFLKKLLELESKYDDYGEKLTGAYTFNEVIIMNSLVYIMMPDFLQEIIERFPPFPQEKIPERAQYPTLPKNKRVKYSSPFEEPVWINQIDWKDIQEVDEKNRYVEYLERKRIPLPTMALFRRPLLIDSRPAYYEQVLKVINFSHRIEKPKVKKKKKRKGRVKKPAVFDSKNDVTAVARIAPSEDDDEKCVFLRWPEPQIETIYIGEDMGENDDDDVDLRSVPSQVIDTYVTRYEAEEANWVGEGEEPQVELIDDERGTYPLKPPPKTTAEEPCLPPFSSPSTKLPENYVISKRRLDILNKETCTFDDVNPDTVTVDSFPIFPDGEVDDPENTLKTAAEILEEYLHPVVPKKKRKRKRKKRPKEEEKPKPKVISLCNPPSYENILKKNDRERVTTSRRRKNSDDKKKRKTSRDSSTKKQRKRSSSRDSSAKRRRRSSSRKDGTRNNSLSKKKRKRRSKSRRKKRKFKEYPVERKYSVSTLPEKKSEEMFGEMEEASEKFDQQDELEEDTVEGEDEREIETSIETHKMHEKLGKKKEEVFKGNVNERLERIFSDLAEEGFVIAKYPKMVEHPIIQHLMAHLRGEILTRRKMDAMLETSERVWAVSMDNKVNLEMNTFGSYVGKERLARANFNDKKWLKPIAAKILTEFEVDVFNTRSKDGRNFYLTTLPQYYYNEKYLKAHYSYFPYKLTECLLRAHQ